MKKSRSKYFSLTTEEFWEELKSTDGLICDGYLPKFEYWAFNSTKNCVDFSDPSCVVWSYDFEHFKNLDDKINKLDASKEGFEISKELNLTENRLYELRFSMEPEILL